MMAVISFQGSVALFYELTQSLHTAVKSLILDNLKRIPSVVFLMILRGNKGLHLT